MSCDLERLQDLLDGELDGAAKAEAERHARDCPACRLELAALRRLAAAARSLPGAIEPARDLWPAIEGDLPSREARRVLPFSVRHRGPAPRRLSRRLYWAAALAALALAWPLAGRWANRSAPAPTAAAPTAATSSALLTAAEQARAEDGMEQIHRDLLQTLAMRRDELSPETLAAVEGNLRLIDEAIGEIHSALARDPANRHLSRLLASQYRREADVLRQINQT